MSCSEKPFLPLIGTNESNESKNSVYQLISINLSKTTNCCFCDRMHYNNGELGTLFYVAITSTVIMKNEIGVFQCNIYRQAHFITKA
jgi:hypothetical protein